MRRLLAVLAFLVLPVSLPAGSLPDRSDQVVDYRISVRLNAETKQLDGQERITWRNPSTEPVQDLWFHLYLNAFKNTKSTFFRESGGQLRGDRFREGKWGWTNIKSLRLADGTDLLGSLRFMHPDDDNADDQTSVRVELPRPVPPGESITLDINFMAQMPQVFARTGYSHDYFLAGQWYPKLGVYEPAGMRGRKEGGWNCHQFHAHSEFYADFGHYLVDLTLPGRFIVGSTGRRISRRENAGGTVTHTYEQADVHDFAWTASPDFVEVKRMFRGGEQVSPDEYRKTASMLGRSLEDTKLSDVEVTVLMQPRHMPQAERHVGAVMGALKYFGLWYGRYPYQTITVVDPGPGGSGSGGMEYPTFITAGTSMLLNQWPFDRVRMPEMVTVHEFGHQFWYGLVGNNEFEEAWIDEGINSYSTGRVMRQLYGSGATLIDFLGLHLGEVDSIRMQNGPDAKFNAIMSFAWKYTPASTYSFYSYTKPEIALFTLENYLGEQTMARIMRAFQERWRFKHPCSEDFFAVANEVAGRDLSWYFSPVFKGSDILDYEIASISTQKAPAHFGVFDQGGKTQTISREEADKTASEVEKSKKPADYESIIVVQRRGEVRFPVDVALKFEGLPPEIRHWDGDARTITYRVTRPQKLEWADVDPERKILLDVDWLNNSRRTKSDAKASVYWGKSFLFWIQNLIAWIGM